MNATAARPAQRYRCRCQHVFQVFGGGRHRRFYELDDPRWKRPVMARLCPSCQQPAAHDPRPAVAGHAAMKILDRLRNRSPRGEAGDPGSAEASSADEQWLPIARYDQLDGKQVFPQLSQLSQVELAAVEAHERSHRERPVVLNRLRWLRGSEPLPGYDALDSDEIVRALADADAATVKAVRSYERHHRDRREVRAEAARVLPTARASAGEDRAREEKAALVQAGIRSDPRRDTS